MFGVGWGCLVLIEFGWSLLKQFDFPCIRFGYDRCCLEIVFMKGYLFSVDSFVDLLCIDLHEFHRSSFRGMSVALPVALVVVHMAVPLLMVCVCCLIHLFCVFVFVGKS